MDEDEMAAFTRSILHSRARELFLECQIRALQKVFCELGAEMKFAGPDGEPMDVFLSALTSATVEHTLANLSDEDPALAAELKRILGEHTIEPGEISGTSETP